MRTATAVIIARAGSKGMPGKNSRMLAGRPMVHHSIEQARAAESVGRIIVSTDCAVVTEQARGAEAEVIARPEALATDTATVDSAVRHAVAEAKDRAEVVVILYGNVPIRPTGLIDRAVRMLEETGADSVQSYAGVGKHHPFWEVKIDSDGRVSPYATNTVYRRQDLPPLFLPDGGVIAVTRRSLETVVEGEPHAFLGKDRRGVINEAGEVIDIDSEIDFVVAEAILKAGKGG